MQTEGQGGGAVPLSEHEQRLLDQIERALYAEDPKFASTVRTTDLRTVMRRRLRWAAVVFVVGFALLLVGVTEPVVGIMGFLVMLSAFVLALSAWKRLSGAAQTGRATVATPVKRRSRKHVSARQRLEERWQRRWDERGGSR